MVQFLYTNISYIHIPQYFIIHISIHYFFIYSYYRQYLYTAIKKTWHRSVTRVTFAVKNYEFAQFGTHPRIPRILRIKCQEPRLGTDLPRAPGARMTCMATLGY